MPRASGDGSLSPGMEYEHPDTRAGSPPHMRGTRSRECGSLFTCRITPAHAGNTNSRTGSFSTEKDHPRTCGEHRMAPTHIRMYLGSPPHMRGTPNERWWTNAVHQDHPRTCGEHLRSGQIRPIRIGSPPHMRGTRLVSGYLFERIWITPAHAGNTCVYRRQQRRE